jgi:hypothetical protein
VAAPTRLERATGNLVGTCSIQLSYGADHRLAATLKPATDRNLKALGAPPGLLGMARRPGEAMISRPVSPSSWKEVCCTEMAISVNLFGFSHEKNAMPGKSKSISKAKDDLEFFPNAWERFEHAVDTVIKSGPMHRQRPQGDVRKERPASKGRVHKGKSRT